MKKIFTIGLFLVLSLSLTSCGHIEDTNGDDDFSIQTITEERILSGSSYSMTSSKKVTINNKTTMSVKKFSGVYTLYDFDLEDDENLNFTIYSEVTKGNFKMVLTQDKKIVKNIPINTINDFSVSNKGDYKIKLVGESAAFELSFLVY